MASAILNETSCPGNPAMAPITTLPFNDHEVPVYNVDGQNFLAGPDLARLLGYKSVNSIVMIHKRHADELDPHSRPINLIGRDGKPRLTRTYDEPGSYLLTMFAGTERAKDVRLWLANLPRRTRELACSIQPAAPVPEAPRLTTAKERNALTGLVNRYVGMLPGGPNQEAYKAAWRKVHDVMGIKAIEELTVEQLPRAVLFVKTLVDAATLPGDEPKALPTPQPRTLQDYAWFYPALPDNSQIWRRLSFKAADAFERFGKELDAIKAEAFAPFKENRRSGVATFLDEAMGPHYALFRIADEQMRVAYRCVYEAMDGLIAVFALLRKG